MNDNSKAHVNDVIKTMLERSSIRAYTDEKLTQEQISLLRDAALSAPTAMNAQDQRFVFVTNAEIIAELEAVDIMSLSEFGGFMHNILRPKITPMKLPS